MQKLAQGHTAERHSGTFQKQVGPDSKTQTLGSSDFSSLSSSSVTGSRGPAVWDPT